MMRQPVEFCQEPYVNTTFAIEPQMWIRLKIGAEPDRHTAVGVDMGHKKVSIVPDIRQDTWIRLAQLVVAQEMGGGFAHRRRMIAFTVIVEVSFTDQARSPWI